MILGDPLFEEFREYIDTNHPFVNEKLTLSQIDVYPLFANISNTPESSLARMKGRNGLLVRIQDDTGIEGWGEIWCNFPSIGVPYRAKLLKEVITERVCGKSFRSAFNLITELTTSWRRLAVHVGETGPFSSGLAGLDMALWDLVANRVQQPLHRLLSGEQVNTKQVKVYCSTPPPTSTAKCVAGLKEKGYNQFKIKVGYGIEEDLNRVKEVRQAIGDNAEITIDANQSWSVSEAIEYIKAFSEFNIKFVEEPLFALSPQADWDDLSQHVTPLLAAGENITSHEKFRSFLSSPALQVFQPDVAKWSGITASYVMGRKVLKEGRKLYPHFMGTAVGLAASFHLLAALGGDGAVEVDANENPLRTELTNIDLSVSEGKVQLPSGAGLGISVDRELLEKFRISY